MSISPEAVALLAIRRRIEAACKRCGREPASVTLVAAAKTVAATRLQQYLDAGLQDIGENYVQEGVAKIEVLGREAARWHLIGALQRNKAREVVRAFDVVHSVDRVSLARALDAAAGEIGKVQTVLLQVNLGDESSKAGCAPHELPELWRACHELPHLSVRGLMALPPYQPDAEAARPYFRQLREWRDELNVSQSTLNELSMGMSNDFEIAIEEGATMVRVGTALFGARSAF